MPSKSPIKFKETEKKPSDGRFRPTNSMSLIKEESTREGRLVSDIVHEEKVVEPAIEASQEETTWVYENES